LDREQAKSLALEFQKGNWGLVAFCRLLRASQDEGSAIAHVAQLAEHVLGKDEVISSSLIMGSSLIFNGTKKQKQQDIAWQKKRFKEPNHT
jgi:hypothetical protein